MARKKSADLPGPGPAALPPGSLGRTLRFAGWTCATVFSVFGLAFFLFEWRQFLSRDPRFALPEAGLSSSAARGITVEGASNASRAAILRVFDPDRGRSLIDIDPARRRAELRRIDWVRDASVRRVWPNQIHVAIEERVPVAFVQAPSGISGSFGEPVRFRPMLIDADGVILPLRGPVPRALPLLLGVSQQEDVERRRKLVQLMLAVLEELAPVRANIPEVDLTDPDNVRITYQAPAHLVVLVLGNERYLDRLNVFLRHYDGIRDRLTHRAVLDVTTDGRITLVEVPPEEKR